MVIDAANGVEAQTRRLIEVCRQRNTPIITFVNKMDREVREPLDILDEEVERSWACPACPSPGRWAGQDLRRHHPPAENQAMTVFESGSERRPQDFRNHPLAEPTRCSSALARRIRPRKTHGAGHRRSPPGTMRRSCGRQTPVFFGSGSTTLA